ncbi:MAG: agmatine deiminase family protein, partial [Myxococcota bacterium]
PLASYLNYVLTNGLVLIPKFGGERRPPDAARKDQEVLDVFKRLYPERKVVQIDTLPINWFGGGMHCVTQQQPALD